MNISKVLNWRVSSWEKVVLLAGATGYGVIIYRYRFQMGDFGDFAKAGKMIWGNTDPYSQLMYVNSPVSAVVTYGLSIALPFLFVPAFWQLLNILGLFFFFRTILKSDFHRSLPVVFSIFAFFNVTRALFANVQVTGLVLGLIAIGMTLIKHRRSALISMIPIWLAAEVKPQLAIGFIAILLFQGKVQKLRIFYLSFLVVLSHAMVEVKFNGEINRLWVEKLLRYSTGSLEEGYEISYWKSLAIYSGQISSIRVVATLFLVATFMAIVYFALKRRLEIALFLALFFPFQNTYLHLYDLAPIGILFILVLNSSRSFPIIIGTGTFLQFFPLSIETQILVAFISTTTALFIKRKAQRIWQFIFLQMIFVFTITLIFYLTKDQSQELQIATALVTPVAALLAIYRRDFVSPLDSELMSR
jgi:hypothetical protein